MTLSEKIYELRRQSGMSQEELAERLKVSRQSISRWENGSAQPDASNLSQLAKLFNVTADYLINEEYNSDTDVPIVKNTEIQAKKKILKILGACITLFGLIGNFVIYILSRFVKVPISNITYNNAGEKIYVWDGATGYSYQYFIQEHHLLFLVILFWLLVVTGIFVAFVNKQKVSKYAEKVKDRIKAKKTNR